MVKSVFIGGPADGEERDYEHRAVEYFEFSGGYASRCGPGVARIWRGTLHVYQAKSLAALGLASFFGDVFTRPVEYLYAGEVERQGVTEASA